MVVGATGGDGIYRREGKGEGGGRQKTGQSIRRREALTGRKDVVVRRTTAVVVNQFADSRGNLGTL